MTDIVGYFNGNWVPRSEIKISVTDRGFRTSDVVFDVARTFNGKIFKRDVHLDRLYRSLKYVRIDPGLSRDEMGDLLEEGVRRNEEALSEVGDFYIWPFATRGPGRWASVAGPPTVGIDYIPLDFTRFSRFFDVGVHGVIAKTRSYSAQSVDPKIKHDARMNFNLAELEAADVDEDAFPILLDLEGNLTEGTINSVFMVTDGVLRTAEDSTVLQSVSRGTVFELAEQLGIPVREEVLQPYDLYTADESFVAFTGPGVLPMTRVDNRDVGDGKPGPITQQLLAAWSEKVGIDIIDQAARFAEN